MDGVAPVLSCTGVQDRETETATSLTPETFTLTVDVCTSTGVTGVVEVDEEPPLRIEDGCEEGVDVTIAVAISVAEDKETLPVFDTHLSEASGMSTEKVTLFFGSFTEAVPSESDLSLLVGETT